MTGSTQLREDDLHACRARVANSSWSAAASALTPIVTTYTTKHPGAGWRLGLSAALHGVPLVVGGLGGKSWGLYGQSNAGRVLGSERMFEVLHELHVPATAPVAFVDSGDVVIVRDRLAEAVPHGVTLSAGAIAFCRTQHTAAPLLSHSTSTCKGA